MTTIKQIWASLSNIHPFLSYTPLILIVVLGMDMADDFLYNAFAFAMVGALAFQGFCNLTLSWMKQKDLEYTGNGQNDWI